MNTILKNLKEAAAFGLFIVGMNVLLIVCAWVDLKVINVLLRHTH